MFTFTKAEHYIYTATVNPFIETFTADTIVGDISEHMSRNVNYNLICHRIFCNSLGCVDAYDIEGRRVYHNCIPVPYYGEGAYEDAIVEYFENVVVVIYRPEIGLHVKIVVRFTADMDKLNRVESVYKSMYGNAGFDIELTEEWSEG